MAHEGSLVCVGLGMTLGSHLSPLARSHIEQADVVFAGVSDGIVELWLQGMHPDVRSLQPYYREGLSRLRTYEQMVEAILTEVRAGRKVVGAFYGHPGVFALPRNHAARARKVLDKLGVQDKALILDASDLGADQESSLAGLVPQCWDLDEVAQHYRNFSATFAPLLRAAGRDAPPDLAFALRALTLHEWRRIVLHDPQLPAQMLPADWPGLAARELCGELYWTVFDRAEEHLIAVISRDPSHYRELDPRVYQRFAGHSPAAVRGLASA